MTASQAGKPRKRYWLRAAAGVVLFAATIPMVVLAALSAFSRRPSNLGVTDERLADCPDTPNCVSTFATDDVHRQEPFTFTDSPALAVERLKRVIEAMPGAKIISTTERYIHAEFTSRVFRFVDDVEFLVDAEKRLIHFRSASRAGRSDLGVNRKRMEAVRHAFAGDQD